MGVMAKWGPMTFEVTPQKITPLTGFKTAFKLKSDANNDTSGTPPTNTRGRELESVQFTVKYAQAAGTTPRSQMGTWRSLIGKVYVLYIGGKAWGAANFQLEAAELTNVVWDSNGNMLEAEVAITLTEYTKSASKETTTAASKQAALSAKPSSEQKAAKAP